MKFKKKPIEVEARRFNSTDPAEQEALAEWRGGARSTTTYGIVIIIPTLEGNHIATFGDWIVRGVRGEFYPCKPDVFDATYEALNHRALALECEMDAAMRGRMPMKGQLITIPA